MIRKKIVISGVGVISPLGIGRDAFWQGLKQGSSGIRPISLFDTGELATHLAGEVVDFDAVAFLGRKGLKYLDRSTRLLCAATSLALEDGVLADAGEEPIGLVVGTTFGSIDSISGFDRESLIEGSRYVNPMDFPKTVINSPAGHAAIKYGLKGLNATVSSGSISGLQAINYAVDYLQMGYADLLLAGGVEELCLPSYLGFEKLGLLSGSRAGEEEKPAPFDLKRNGLVLGEAAAVLVLETEEHAHRRDARVYGELAGYANTHDAHNAFGYQPQGAGAVRAMQAALGEANLLPHQVDHLSASANGSRDGDRMEAKAIGAVFGEHTPHLTVHALKSTTGECLGASGVLQTIAALLTLTGGVVPPTNHYQEAEPAWNLAGLSQTATLRNAAVSMINAFGCDGNNASLVVRSHD